MYSGVHGRTHGQNWVFIEEENDYKFNRELIDSPFLNSDERRLESLAYDFLDMSFVTYDMSVCTRRDLFYTFGQPGHHVMAYCFSANDCVVKQYLGEHSPSDTA